MRREHLAQCHGGFRLRAFLPVGAWQFAYPLFEKTQRILKGTKGAMRISQAKLEAGSKQSAHAIVRTINFA